MSDSNNSHMTNQDKLHAELNKLEVVAALPKSGWAFFMQVIGALGVLGSLYLLLENILFGAAGMMASGFILAAAGLQQAIFDIRTLLLRDRFKAQPMDKTNA